MTKNERPVVLRYPVPTPKGYLAKRAKEGTKLASRPGGWRGIPVDAKNRAKEKEKEAQKEKEANFGLGETVLLQSNNSVAPELTTAAVSGSVSSQVLQQQPNPSTTLLSNRPHVPHTLQSQSQSQKPLPRQSNSAIPSPAKSAQPLRAQTAKSTHQGAATSVRAVPPVATSQPPIRTQTTYSVVPPSSSARIVTNVGGSSLTSGANRLPLSTTSNPPRAQVSRPQGFRPPAPSNPASSNPNHQVQSKRPNASMANTIHTNTSATDYASQAAHLMSQAFPTQPAVVPPSRQAIFEWRLKEAQDAGWTNEQAHVLAEMQSSDLLRRMQQPSISTAQTVPTSGDQATGIGFAQPLFPAGMASQHQNPRTSLPPTGQQQQGSHGQQSISYSPFSQTILSAQPSMPQTHLPTASGNITSNNLTDKPPTAQVDMSDVLQFITLMAQQVNNVAPTTNLSNPTVPPVMSTTMGAFLTSSIPTATLTSFPQQTLPQSNQIVASLPSGNRSWIPQFSVSGSRSGVPGLSQATTSVMTEGMSETAATWMANQVNTLVPAQPPQGQVSSKLQELRKLYQSDSPDSVTSQYRTAFLKLENAKILQTIGTIGMLCKLILDGCRSPLGIDLPLESSLLIATFGDMIWEFYEVRRAERIEKICEATSFPPTLFSANEKIDVWAWDERRTQTAPPTFQQDPFKVIRFLWEQRDRYYQTLFHSDKGETVHQTSLTPALMQNPASSSSNPPIQPVIKDPKSKSLPALQVAENKPEMAPLLAAKAEHQDKEVVLISDDEQ
ncbi:hypothetical protein BT69DRAFT_1283962, partial [Atractiella rhizophila]